MSKKHVQVAISNDLSHDIVFVPSDKDIEMFEIFSGKKISKLQGHYGNVNCCHYDRNLQASLLNFLISYETNFFKSSCLDICVVAKRSCLLQPENITFTFLVFFVVQGF